MEKKELIAKIISKKEFSKLRKKDIEIAFSHFDKETYLDEEKIKLTRDLLRKVFSVFTSRKLLSLKNKDEEWILKKHLSTRERLPYYEELYSKIFPSKKKTSVLDFGAGVNGFSYKHFPFKVNYIGVEAMGQLVDLLNEFFKKNKIQGEAHHLSLFELDELKMLIKKLSGEKMVFLFKALDSLEMLERNYSKKLLTEIVPLVDRVVVSFATKSLIARKKFNVKRNWIINFLKDNFEVLDDFYLEGERYLVFRKKK